MFITDNKRVFGLDIIRALAILIVVSHHGAFMLKGTILEDFPYIHSIDGVDIFFVLSGFLIGGILLRKYDTNTPISLYSLFGFWKRRWFRTLPNYYLVLLLNYCVVKWDIIQEDITQFNWRFLVFIQNFNRPFYDFFWESWSLSVEEWFYIIVPIVFTCMSRVYPVKWAFLMTTLGMISFSMTYRYVHFDNSLSFFWWDVSVRKVVLSRLDSIGFGLLASWIYHYHNTFWVSIRIYALTLGMIGLFCVCCIPYSYQSIFTQVFYFPLISVSVMCMLPIAECYKMARGFFPYLIEHISKISYSMYLINLALVAEVIRDNYSINHNFGIFHYIVYWMVVFVCASLLYRYFEKPMLSLRDTY